MNSRGFTLVEILIVIGITGILLSIATLQFSDYLRKGVIDRQTKELYSDLMATRTAAVTQRSSKRVIIEPASFTFISSAMGSGSVRTTRVLSKPVTWAGKASGDTEKQIIFDERGTFDLVNNGNTTICVAPSLESAQYDSIVVFSTRIHVGKLTGVGCTSGNVTVK